MATTECDTAPGGEWLAQQFEERRPRLRVLAYRMLGSLSDADDAVQEAWLRLTRSEAGSIENVDGWLTTVIGRVCLDMLRARKSRREDSLDTHAPDLILSVADDVDIERDTVIADAVGIALLVVLDTLSPSERLAFVLHDMFAVPFDEIAEIVGCSPAASRQLASRARRRVRGAASVSEVDRKQQRQVVDAFLAAVRDRNFTALLAVLDPDVTVRSDRGVVREVRGARVAAAGALLFSTATRSTQPLQINGAPGVVSWRADGEPFAVLWFTVTGKRITVINVMRDSKRLGALDFSMLRPEHVR